MDQQVGKYFKVTYKIHNGRHSNILCAQNKLPTSQFALKIQLKATNDSQILFESKVAQYLINCDSHMDTGIPKVWFAYKNLDGCDIMVMDLLGPNLEDLFNLCGRKFSLKTVLMLADQMIQNLEHIHSKNFIHKNIEPANFLIGTGKSAHKLYIIDFGLAKRYPEKMGKRLGCGRKPFEGSELFASITAHQYIEGVNRRDDLESLGYILIYFLKGKLPWQNLGGLNKYDRLEKIENAKISTKIEDLCEGLPKELAIYLTYIRNDIFKWKQEPDHSHLRSLLKGLFDQQGYQMDYIYDWNLIKTNDAQLAQAHIYDWNLIKMNQASYSKQQTQVHEQQALTSQLLSHQSKEQIQGQAYQQILVQVQVQAQIAQLELGQTQIIEF